MLIFAFESVFRGFQQTAVYTRCAGTVRVCVLTVAMMLFITWLPLGFVKPFKQCLPGLAWWSSPFNALATPILCTMLALALISSVTIVVQLTRWRKRSSIERLVALQMLSYMSLLVVLSVSRAPSTKQMRC